MADVRMVESGDGAGFLLEALAMVAFEPLESYQTVEPRVPRFPHLTHTAGAQV
jgi:hypothetical protein